MRMMNSKTPKGDSKEPQARLNKPALVKFTKFG